MHHVPEGEVLDVEVDRDHRHPGRLVDQARDAEADAVDVRYRGTELLDRLHGGLDHLGLLHPGDLPQGAGVHLEVLVDHAAQQLGASEVDADDLA